MLSDSYSKFISYYLMVWSYYLTIEVSLTMHFSEVNNIENCMHIYIYQSLRQNLFIQTYNRLSQYQFIYGIKIACGIADVSINGLTLRVYHSHYTVEQRYESPKNVERRTGMHFHLSNLVDIEIVKSNTRCALRFCEVSLANLFDVTWAIKVTWNINSQ